MRGHVKFIEPREPECGLRSKDAKLLAVCPLSRANQEPELEDPVRFESKKDVRTGHLPGFRWSEVGIPFRSLVTSLYILL
jgi:hypothetical protein